MLDIILIWSTTWTFNIRSSSFN